MKKPTIGIARRACEAAEARQAIVVVFDHDGRCAVVTYGETKREARRVEWSDEPSSGEALKPFVGPGHELEEVSSARARDRGSRGRANGPRYSR